MAGYHYKLQIVPNSVSVFNEENYWEKVQPSGDFLCCYRKLLPIDKTWGETEEYRSDENHSVLNIWWENKNVWSVQFEYAPIDKGEDTLLNEILALCIKYGCNFYSEQTKSVVSPNKKALWNDFKKCEQYKIYGGG
jgi:hypothetical protein